MPFITNQQLTPADVETPRKLGITGVKAWWMLNRETADPERIEFHVVELAPGFKHDLHRHPRAGELVYILEGEGLHLAEGVDPVLQVKGDLTYIPAGEWHGLANASETEPLVVIGITEGATHYEDAGYEDHPTVVAAGSESSSSIS
jgi:quercetin dioxygenase-like cupin family protein